MKYGVDPTELQGLLDGIARFEKQLETRLADAEAEVNRLHSAWSGEAAEAHRAAHAAWQRSQREIQTALAVMRKAAATAHANYAAASKANIATWGSL